MKTFFLLMALLGLFVGSVMDSVEIGKLQGRVDEAYKLLEAAGQARVRDVEMVNKCNAEIAEHFVSQHRWVETNLNAIAQNESALLESIKALGKK